MQVPFLDLARQHRPLQAKLLRAAEAVLESGRFVLGPFVEDFEEEFARYVGRRHCVGVNSGTSALHLALAACDVGPGDEVITTAHSWISTAWAISYVGARPVFVDIDPATYGIDPGQVAAAITPRTKAIVPVHLYGQCCDVVALREIADRHGLGLIEDAAQAHGAIRDGRRAGAFGQLGCFSFFPAKNLGACGEAGAVVTDDDDAAARIRALRDHAQRGRHHHVEVGYNMRMEAMQGAMLGVKLPHLDDWNAARRRLAAEYRRRLAGIDVLRLPAAPAASESHVWHLFVVLAEQLGRDALRTGLSERGVETGVHYPKLMPFQPAYESLGYRAGDFPVAEHVARHCVSLPLFPELTDEELDHVCRSVGEVCAAAATANGPRSVVAG